MLVNPRVEAWSSKAVIARLSASSGEEMWLMKVDPRCSSFFAESVKIHGKRLMVTPSGVHGNFVSALNEFFKV
ncbi:hypothetical protein F2Q69_00057722 [Brassica cretica]|uniref:Uncharacterized protein n=1 Tax=Brassica cretica TaxID=69181 RepID=A0A8S9MW98_BRACR|nr:hypothetical protein F2Q69_00057722 [Brassica cretica]